MSRIIVLLALGCWLIASAANAAKPTAQGIEFFENKIRPVLVKHCYECHAADAKKIGGEFLLDTRAGMLEGGESGEVIVLGNPQESLLISALNKNTPYDRFLAQQIAVDLLPTKTIQERDENRIATGFLALASKPSGIAC
jgi:hypothetical protein